MGMLISLSEKESQHYLIVLAFFFSTFLDIVSINKA